MNTNEIPRPVPARFWGRDHWSAFLYIEDRCVNHKGVPNHAQLRTSQKLHPGRSNPLDGSKYPTRIKDPESGAVIHLPDHDGWSCAEDLEAAGLIEDIGTGINPLYKMTPLGSIVAGMLRNHKAKGGTCHAFFWNHPDAP